MKAYRITGSYVDMKADSKDFLIKTVSAYRGVFVLWAWNSKQWIRIESFSF